MSRQMKWDNFPRGKGNLYTERNCERGANRYRRKAYKGIEGMKQKEGARTLKRRKVSLIFFKYTEKS